MKRRAPLPLTLFFAVCLPIRAWACPVCDTDTGREVRRAIVGEDVARNVLATTLPFAVVFGAVALIHFGGRGKRGNHGAR